MSGEGTFSVAQELDAEVPLAMKIAGIGEADTDSVQYMRQHDASGVELIAANSDRHSLDPTAALGLFAHPIGERMESIIADQLEWLISGNMEGLRFKRQLLLLSGCLADGEMPSDIASNIAKLTQRIAQEEVFSALIDSLNICLRQIKPSDAGNMDISALVAQVEAARHVLDQCEPANIALIVTWLLGRARERKLLKKPRALR